MNIPAAIISAGIGAALFAAMNAFQYRPSLITPDYSLGMMFATKHSKARSAVTRLLIDPASADFSALRSVEEDAAEYVCGTVRAKDKSGHYVEYRAFVYTVATDFARIDDDGRIAHRHGAFRKCPISEEKDVALRKMPISEGAASMVKTIQTIIPTADPTILSTMTPDMSAGGAKSSGGTLQQQVGQMASQLGSAGQPGSVGQQGTSSTFKAALRNESAWRSEHPPAAWPTFPSDHPMARPAQKRTAAQAMALAKDVEDRWERSNFGASISRPSSDEIQEACRALLAIDPKDEAYPKAWAAFVRLRKIDRDRAS
ncbi:hypothetical protein GWE18_05475 [Bradyrhizobium sp. CSA112]|uniref:hypothetical protein n=1 Tax=Bradyrhizobium sp. CSA112 TaxID=2699170 RepID=UPI0023B10CFE|nr:hypothetical protein [Bradyrhizobium sp. CSA112]MDE5452329.1 hypothetical protein [Bradyrhizobium sp. CSA112]